MKISTDVKLIPEEPDALIGHVRVCGGSGEVTPRFYPARSNQQPKNPLRGGGRARTSGSAGYVVLTRYLYSGLIPL
jgi:hypothetical protein